MNYTFAQQPESKKKPSHAAKPLETTFSPAVEPGAVAGVPLFLQRSSVSQTNAILQPKLTVSEPGDIYEQEADRVAEQVMKMPSPASIIQQEPLLEGKEEQVQAKRPVISPKTSIFGKVANNSTLLQRRHPRGASDVFNTRTNEKLLDEYEDAVDDLQDFKKQNYSKYSSPGAIYFPSQNNLRVKVIVGFKFQPEEKISITPEEIERANAENRPATLTKTLIEWTSEEQQEFKGRFLRIASADWSFNHIMYAHKDWWENLRASVIVNFVEGVSALSNKPDRLITVSKEIAERSHVFGANVLLHKEDVEGTGKKAGHEAGHMLGLGDEYGEAEKTGQKVRHSELIEEEFGPKRIIIRGSEDPESIMSTGTKILPEHGVVFLKIIRDLAPQAIWHLYPKSPRPIP
ncbi:hypothetical protein AB3R30_07215 [Leptolyngbyaceae cyanobacterium UHCC 1019]